VRNKNRKCYYAAALLSLLTFLILSCPNPLVIEILKPKTASFETNGGGFIESQTVYKAYPIKRPSNPSREGYTFDAWYVDNETFLLKWDFKAIPTADITLYAKWISKGGKDDPDPNPEPDPDPEPENGHTVTFVYNNGSGNTTRIVSDGGKIPAPTTPARGYPPTEGLYRNKVPTEYDFEGWLTADGDLWNFSNDTVHGDLTLYAEWTLPNRVETNNSNIIDQAITYINDPANANAEKYILLLSAGQIQSGSKTISKNLIIEGIGPATITYNGAADTSLFTITNSATLTLEKNITLTSNISNGTTSLVTVTSGTLVMETSSAITEHRGRAVHVNGGTFNMNDGTISKNGHNAPTGDGVYVTGGTFTMNGGTISENGNNGSEGGGVGVSGGGIFIMNDGGITGNSAPSGGGVHVSNGGKFYMNGGTISGHGADNGGGVAVGSNSTFYMTDGTISGNSANSGGGVNVGSGGIFNMDGGTISGNTVNNTSFGGGGVYSSGIFNMTGGTINGNTARYGGGVSVNNSTFEMTGGTISNNTATDSGGGVFVSGSNGKFTMSSAGIISENYANNGSGGGVCVSSGTFEMNNGTIDGNTASQAGGVYVSGTFNMNDGTISRNTVSGVGGGVHVGGGGIFKISGGTVYGTGNSNANTSQGQGAALHVTTDYGYDGTAIYGDNSPVETTPVGDGSGNYRDTTINGHN